MLRGNQSFFFSMTVSVKLGRIFAVSRVLVVENLKPMVVSLKLGVLAILKAEGLSHRQNPLVSMNTTIGFQVFIPPVIGFFFPVSPKNTRFLEKCPFDQMPVCGNDHSKTGIFSKKMPKRAKPKRAFFEKNDHNYKNDHTQTGNFQII